MTKLMAVIDGTLLMVGIIVWTLTLMGTSSYKVEVFIAGSAETAVVILLGLRFILFLKNQNK